MRSSALRLLALALVASLMPTVVVLAQVPAQRVPPRAPAVAPPAATGAPVPAPVPDAVWAGVQAAPPPAPQAPPAPRPDGRPMPANVRVEVTLTDQTGNAQAFRKTVSLTAADRESGMIRSAIQVPIPSTTFTPAKDPEGEGKPVTSYSYRSMNLNLDVRDVMIEGNRIRLRLGVEYSPVDEKTAEARGIEGLASFASFQQTLTLVLEDGKPLVVAQSSDPIPTRDRKITLEAKATILK